MSFGLYNNKAYPDAAAAPPAGARTGTGRILVRAFVQTRHCCSPSRHRRRNPRPRRGHRPPRCRHREAARCAPRATRNNQLPTRGVRDELHTRRKPDELNARLLSGTLPKRCARDELPLRRVPDACLTRISYKPVARTALDKLRALHWISCLCGECRMHSMRDVCRICCTRTSMAPLTGARDNMRAPL